MNQTKAIVVTIIMAAMLAAIDLCLFFLWMPGFVILTGIMAVAGFTAVFFSVAGWLSSNDSMPENIVKFSRGTLFDWAKEDEAEEEADAEDKSQYTADEIMEEIRNQWTPAVGE